MASKNITCFNCGEVLIKALDKSVGQHGDHADCFKSLKTIIRLQGNQITRLKKKLGKEKKK